MLLFNLFPSLTEYSKINVKCTHSVLQNQCKKITKEKTRTYDFIVITNIYITDTIVHIFKKKYNSDHSNSLKKKLKIFNIKELRTKTTHKINTNDFKTLKILLHKNESIDLIYPLISVSNESGHITRTVVFFFSSDYEVLQNFQCPLCNKSLSYSLHVWVLLIYHVLIQ